MNVVLLINSNNDLNSPDTRKCFKEVDVTQLVWERSKVLVIPNHVDVGEFKVMCLNFY